MLKDKDGNLQEPPIHGAFKLTYASFLVVPRLLMEAMPYEWQLEMVKLMEEFSEKFEWEKHDEIIHISVKNFKGKFTPIDRNLCNYRRGDSNIYLKDSGEAV